MRAESSAVATSRAGFTAIELMIVITVMMVVASLSVGGVLTSLRRAAIHNAGAIVLAAASQAQEQAMEMVRTGGTTYPGVLIAQRGGRWAVAPVAVAEGSSPSFDQALRDEQGEPAISVLAPNVVLWRGDQRADPSEVILWAYEPGTGRTVIPDGSGFSLPGAVVGYQPPSLQGYVFGAGAGDVVPVLAPPVGDQPGLSFRSLDQRSKRSISVQPSGIIEVREIEE